MLGITWGLLNPLPNPPLDKRTYHINVHEKQQTQGLFGPQITIKGSCQDKNKKIPSFSFVSIIPKYKFIKMGRTYQVLASPKDNTSYPVYLKIDKKTIKYAGTFSFFYTYLEKSRESIISFLENSFSSSHNFQLWQALSLGKCSDLSIKHRFQRLGLSHFLAISGFHFSMFFAMLSLLVSWLSSGVYRLLLLTFFLSFYLFLTSSPPSAIRAFLMILTFIITSTLNRRYNALTAWSLALLLMTLFNPSYVYQVGFTLSFIASLSIILLYHPFQKFFLRKSLFLLQKLGLQLSLLHLQNHNENILS